MGAEFVHIYNINKQARAEKIGKVTQELKQKNRQGAPKIWEVRKRLQRKEQCATTVKTTTGQVIEDKNKILEEYKTHYSTLLNTKEAKKREEKETEQEIDQQFEELMKVAKTKQRSDITEEIVIKAIKTMKNKKAPDRRGWRAEWIKEGGPEMIKSITYILNEI